MDDRFEMRTLIAGGVLFLLSALMMSRILPRLTLKKIKESANMKLVIAAYRYASIALALGCFGKALWIFAHIH
jgi:hypothetical protein